jgi:hypothetical protein
MNEFLCGFLILISSYMNLCFSQRCGSQYFSDEAQIFSVAQRISYVTSPAKGLQVHAYRELCPCRKHIRLLHQVQALKLMGQPRDRNPPVHPRPFQQHPRKARNIPILFIIPSSQLLFPHSVCLPDVHFQDAIITECSLHILNHPL